MPNNPTPAQFRAEAERVEKLLEGIPEDVRLVDLTDIMDHIYVTDGWTDGPIFRQIARPPEFEDGSDPYYKLLPHSLALARAHADLLRQHAALLEAQRWIPVEERLPEEDEADILCVFKTGDVYPVTTIFDDGELYLRLYTAARVAIFNPEDITHWQSLPAPPASAPAGGDS